MAKYSQQHIRRCVLTSAIGLSLASGGLQAATFSVTNNADSGPGSLRQAIEEANLAAGDGSHTIDLSAISGETIVLESNLPEIAYNEDPLLIEGGNAILDGAGQFRCIRSDNPFLSEGNDLTIRDFTVQNCAGHPSVSSGETFYFGGGINVASGSLTLERVTVRDNTADYGGGVWASGAATVIDSVITNNSATINVGGINGADSLALIRTQVTDNSAGGNAGGFRCTTALAGCDLSIEDSVITGNSAELGGGGFHYAKYASQSAVIERSTISNNTASYAAGGIFFEFDEAAPASIRHSTISANQAAYGGGILFSAIGSGVQTGLSLYGSTVAANNASAFGGGILLDDPGSNDVILDVTNSIVQANSADQGADIFGVGEQPLGLARIERAAQGLAQLSDEQLDAMSVSAQTVLDRAAVLESSTDRSLTSLNSNINWSLIGVQPEGVTVSFDPASQDLLGGNADLGPLADNGGPTPTHLPAIDSIALDVIPPGQSGCGDAFGTDQRGLPRPAPETAGCDLGAVERQERSVAPPPLAVPIGNPVALTLLTLGLGLLGWLGLRRRRSN